MTETLLPIPVPGASLRRRDAFELLCACSIAHPCPEQIAHLQKIDWDDPQFDWGEFLRIADHHGVLPLAARNLTRYARALPQEIERSLQSAYADNLRRSLWFAAELARIMHHFERKQLPALPYKGPALAQSAYGDLGLRSFSDLDLLISATDFPRAKEALAEIGYHPSHVFPPSVERLWLRTGYERSFDGPAGRNLLELQWNLLPNFYAVDPGSADCRFDDLLARATRTGLGASDVPADSDSIVPTLSSEDSLLAVCLHAAKHLWTRLIWVADIAETLRIPGLDPALVISRASSLGTTRIMGISFWLAERLLGAALAPALRSLFLDDPQCQVLGEVFARRSASEGGYDFESTDYFRQILRLRERPGDRWRILWRLVWTPGPADVAVINLPEPMFPLYRLVRLGRLARKLA